MGQRKAHMEMICDENQRQNRFENRYKTMEKMADELSIRCGVKVCLIVFSRGDEKGIEPRTWSKEGHDIPSLIQSFKNSRVDHTGCKIPDFSLHFKGRIREAAPEDHLAKLPKQNLETKLPKFPTWDQRYDNLPDEEMRQFAALLEAKLEAVAARVDFMKDTRNHPMIDSSSSIQFQSLHHHYQQQQHASFCDPDEHIMNGRFQTSEDIEPLAMANGQSQIQQIAYPDGFHPSRNKGTSISNAAGAFHTTDAYHMSPSQFNWKPPLVMQPTAQRHHISSIVGVHST